jgi:hypothetical protein
MRLVDNEEIHLRGAECLEELRILEPFRRREYEVDIARANLLEDPLDFARRYRRVDRTRPHVQLRKLVRLILHQRDQRRDDNRGARKMERRQLIAQRFARSGGHDRDGVAPGDDRLDDLALSGTELGEPERPVHEALQRFGGRHARSTSNGCAFSSTEPDSLFGFRPDAGRE